MDNYYNLLPKSIYLVGPHCTGKTTLAQALRVHYGPSVLILQETARSVLLEKGYRREDIESPKCLDMQKDILLAQYEAEQVIFRTTPPPTIISDRAGIDPILYAKKYSPNSQDWKMLCAMEEWKVLRDRYRDTEQSIVILILPVQAFLVDDGTRKMPLDFKEWENFGEMFQNFLGHQGIPFKVIDYSCVSIQDRVNQVVCWAGRE